MKRSSADPYRDLDVIDARAPRFNQLVIGSLALTAFLVDWWPLYAILAVQLALGLTLGRRWCLSLPRLLRARPADLRRGTDRGLAAAALLEPARSCVPRRRGDRAHGGCRDARLGARAARRGARASGRRHGALRRLEAYRLGARLRGIRPRPLDRIDLEELGAQAGDDLVVQFTHPLCTDCRALERRLRGDGRSVVTVDVSQRPEIARKYGISVVPTALAVSADGSVSLLLAG